ncbi:esterase, PHB depolymerase family [Streptomyces sp. 2231.1]|uniref:extracellular catalytic domain type 1 short-chain-length polyhydroxyalkanoate depolymerase n=1 Tax=Streptomyces sp. 2231.1 TaxID=1855347 RepID=UPI000896A761|nr:PHB depolymerase family esterase [Streptomyces sp. 2231.1]SEC36035.1 esterase, PHB depolymerase family [Streptomyces sp. 2231.1]
MRQPAASKEPPAAHREPLARTTAPGRSPRRPRRLLACLLAVGAVVLGTALAGPLPTAHASVTLTRVSGFGSNPGALTMYVYRPASLTAHPPVVVALHGCTQSAQVYADNSGLPQLADQDGFLLVLAETTTANNANKCFNWFQSTDNRRDQGEALSVRQMVGQAVTAYGADPRRVYVTGLSAGGAMTSVMLATYPDVFTAGAVVAGLPYDCTKDNSPYLCMNPGVDLTPDAWAQRVRDAHPSYQGPWPRTAIWYGDQDTTVAPRNATELRDQWTALHGLSQTPTRTRTIGSDATRQDQYLAADGTVAVEVDRVPGIGHGTPVDPGTGTEQCGATGAPYFPDSICSSRWIARFFGLDTTDPGGSEPGDGGTAACWTASNYAQVQAGRATTSGGYAYAVGSRQNMGLYNTFVTHTLKESPTGYYTLADSGCP